MDLNLDNANLINDNLMIPNDDGSITFIPREDATSDELAMFAKFEAVFPKGKPIEVSLENAKTSKITEIEVAYTAAIQAGFTSSASGTETSFIYDDKAQAKFNKLLSALAAGVLTFPYTVYSADLIPISLTQDELKQLFTDLTNFETELEAKLLTLIGKVNAAKTVDEVSAISWT